jgi:hypothetical protein
MGLFSYERIAAMIEIAGGIILAVFGLIAVFVVLGVAIRVVEWLKPRPRRPGEVPWYKYKPMNRK